MAEDSLLYMSKIGALKLEGGFLVLYNAMEIKRIVRDNRIKYKCSRSHKYDCLCDLVFLKGKNP